MTHSDDHAECDPNTCFAAKMRFWRAHGVGVARIPKEKSWGEMPSLRQRERETVDAARMNGYDPVRVS